MAQHRPQQPAGEQPSDESTADAGFAGFFELALLPLGVAITGADETQSAAAVTAAGSLPPAADPIGASTIDARS
jgi:hypothetical protein